MTSINAAAFQYSICCPRCGVITTRTNKEETVLFLETVSSIKLRIGKPPLAFEDHSLLFKCPVCKAENALPMKDEGEGLSRQGYPLPEFRGNK